jgi:hypothetical protein
LLCRFECSYTPQEAGELGFKAGDTIAIVNQDPSGWWEGKKSSYVFVCNTGVHVCFFYAGTLRGIQGVFPSNYVSTESTI